MTEANEPVAIPATDAQGKPIVGLPARLAAWQVLVQWVDLEMPPLVPERHEDTWKELDARQRAQAYELTTGVIRWRGLLDHVLVAMLRGKTIQDLEPLVRAILWLGAYQILLQPDTQVYAVVDTAVEITRLQGGARATGFVNGVLRNVARLQPRVQARGRPHPAAFAINAKQEVILNQPLFGHPVRLGSEFVARTTSHPKKLVEMFQAAFPARVAGEILIADNVRPVPILRCDEPAWVPPTDANLLAHSVKGYWVPTDGWNATIETLVATGQLSPQDPTAGQAVRLLQRGLKERMGWGAMQWRGLDLCAGLGTKALQMARQLEGLSGGTVRITASDIDGEKLQRCAERAKQCGLEDKITVLPAEQLTRGDVPKFDFVLVDAPCSNSGVLARRVQARWRWPWLVTGHICQLQGQLLKQANALLAPGGMLVYATCSLDPRENGLLVDTVLATQPGLKKISMETFVPTLSEDVTQRCDGGFAALVYKKA